MRKIMALALLALACGFTASVAEAQQMTAPHLVTIPVKFRTSAANSQGFVDSVTFSKQGAGTNVADTTQSISTIGIFKPASFTLDSSWTGRLILTDAGSTGTIDSLYCTLQVSADGSNWISSANVQLSLARAATTNSKVFSRKFGGAQAAAVTVDENNILGWPLIRFIIYNDGSSATVIHNFRAYWSYLSATDQPNQ